MEGTTTLWLGPGNVTALSQEVCLRIAEVCPSFDTESVALRNDGTSSAEIRGYVISDGEGRVILETNLTLEPDEEIVLCSNLSFFQRVCPGKLALPIQSNNTSVIGRFALADKGDEVILADRAGIVTDVIVYGDSDYAGPGWNGKPVVKPPKGHEILRIHHEIQEDTNTSSDWLVAPPGRSDFAPITATALVEPFLAPDNARSRLIREFEYSSSSIHACVYELDDPNIVSALVASARRGVTVEVLLEGQPVGGLPDKCRSAALELDYAGVIVSFLKSKDSYKRYDYLHCKYAVIDGRRCVIMSENWVVGGINHNRGWGVVAENRELASFLLQVFEQDSADRSPDVWPIDEMLERQEDSQPVAQDQAEIDLMGLVRFEASVRPLVAPDFSLKRMRELIENAKSRILVEQFYCQPSWVGSDSLLSSLFSTASRGVTVRVLLDSSWFNSGEKRNNTEVIDALNRRASEVGVDLRARLVSEYHAFEITHNKGMVVDNVTIVSSMNWADSSFNENREIGLEIWSDGVASYFSNAFWEDWAIDPYPPIVNLSFRNMTVYEGTPVWLDASRSTDNVGIAGISWDDGTDGSIEWEGPTQLVRLAPGRHLISVVVVDKFNNSAVSKLEVIVLANGGGDERSLLLWAPLVTGAAGFVAWRILKRIKAG
jgi:phosphatidylserine/phosphatidylglycerophosphate/cardiolipin synthase-like enzyme